MNPDDASATQYANGVACGGSSQALAFVVAFGCGHLFVERSFDKGFSGSTQQNWQVEFCRQTVKLIDELQVLLNRFAKAYAGIKNQLCSLNSAFGRLFKRPATPFTAAK